MALGTLLPFPDLMHDDSLRGCAERALAWLQEDEDEQEPLETRVRVAINELIEGLAAK